MAVSDRHMDMALYRQYVSISFPDLTVILTLTLRSESELKSIILYAANVLSHGQGHGDNRRSSLGPLYRCNVDYEA